MSNENNPLHEAAHSGAIPVTPSLTRVLELARIDAEPGRLHRRSMAIGGLALLVGIVAAVIARGLLALIGLITHLSFEGAWRGRRATRRTTRSVPG